MNTAGFLNNHHGPYRLMAQRPAKKVGFYMCEWLGTSDRDDVESEALALLADPRDTICYVGVWSVSEQCFCGGFTA
jgi:hypothetical protein